LRSSSIDFGAAFAAAPAAAAGAAFAAFGCLGGFAGFADFEPLLAGADLAWGAGVEAGVEAGGVDGGGIDGGGVWGAGVPDESAAAGGAWACDEEGERPDSNAHAAVAAATRRSSATNWITRDSFRLGMARSGSVRLATARPVSACTGTRAPLANGTSHIGRADKHGNLAERRVAPQRTGRPARAPAAARKLRDDADLAYARGVYATLRPAPGGAGGSAADLRSPMLSQLLPELDRIEPRTRAAVAGLPAAKFLEVPPGGGWSVAQVFEHLCLSNLKYVEGPLPAAIARSRARGPSEKPWRQSLTGGLLTRMLVEGTRPLPTTGALRAGLPRPNVVDVFLGSVTRLRALMFEADGHDLRVGFSSPVAAIVRLNIGDAFRMLVFHSHRHLGQAERTRRAVGT